MNISIKQQVTATYARNNFKAVTEKALKEGKCFIMRKSKPTTVVLSMKEYEAMQERYIAWINHKAKTVKKKITIEELRKDSTFDKFVGTMKNFYPNLSSVEAAKKWTDYVD